jgi:hypothetical protein
MKINYRRKTKAKRSPVAPPTFRHTDKKHESSKRACRGPGTVPPGSPFMTHEDRELNREVARIGGYLPLFGANLD